jgi:hypothetical protein
MPFKPGDLRKFKYLGASHAAVPEIELNCVKEDKGVYLMFGTGATIEGPAREGQELLELAENKKYLIAKVNFEDDTAAKFKNRFPRPVLSVKLKPLNE